MSALEGCAILENVTFLDRLKLGHNVLKGCDMLKVINVPPQCVDYYKEQMPENMGQFIAENNKSK